MEKSKSVSVNAGNLPEKKFRAGGISATVWQNSGKRPNGEESKFNTISIERSYKDKDGSWKTTNSFRMSDLPKLSVVAQKAYEYVIFKSGDGYSMEEMNSAI